MDPFSIAVSAVSVAGAAAKISFFLYEVIESTSKVDSMVRTLHKEVKSLEQNLKALDGTLQGCRSQALVLMHMNNDIWQSIESNLQDCRETLEELTSLVEEVKRPSGSRSFFRKQTAVVQLSLRKKEITEFQDKIGKSNASMQTAVGVVSLSLAMRQNISQEMLMSELQRLRQVVENTQRVARNSTTSYPAAARMSRNLEGLVQAARRFHSSASSTASTRYGGPAKRRPVVASTWGLGSDAGGLTDYDRDRIRDWRSGLGIIDEVTDTTSTVDTAPSNTGTHLTADRDTVATTPEPEDEGEDDDDLELDLEIFQNAEELGRMSFGKRDYDNAEKFLHKALSGATGTSSDPAHFENLKLQLSICYCFQAKWQAAEAVLSTLGKEKRKVDLPVFHLLHAVALAYLADENYDGAYSACKRSLQGKKKAHGGKTNQDYIDSLALLAAICEVRGEPIEAAAIRHSIPENRMQEGFPEPEEFIREHRSIINIAFGKGFAGSGGRVLEEEEEVHEEVDEEDEFDTGKGMSGGDHEASLPSRVSGWDTGKEVTVQKGGYMTFNPVTRKRIFSSAETFDEETGKILAWADWDSCEWVELTVYWQKYAESDIHQLLVDEPTRQLYGLRRLRWDKPDADKWSDLMVVDIERQHDEMVGSDTHKEAYIPDPSPAQTVRIVEDYITIPSRISMAFGTQDPQWDETPAPPRPTIQLYHDYQNESGAINRGLPEDLSSNIYISEPRGGGVTSAPPLHSGQNSSFQSPMTPPPRPAHHPSRSVDLLSRPFESNNPFRRAASQRSLNNLAMAGSSSQQSQTIRHLASFETTSHHYVPPNPWTARRYGNARESPRVLQTPAVFLRNVPDGRTEGLILGVNLSPETIEVTVSFEDGTATKCPGTLYLNQAQRNSSDLPWFDCLSVLTNPPPSPQPHTPTAPSPPSISQASSSKYPSNPEAGLDFLFGTASPLKIHNNSGSKSAIHTQPPPQRSKTQRPRSQEPFALSTHPYTLFQFLQLHALSSPTTLETFITNTLLPLSSPSTYASSSSSLEASLVRLQSGLAKWIDTVKGALYTTFTPLDEIIFSVPDTLLSMPTARTKFIDLLSRNELFRHAKVTPASVAVVWYYLSRHATPLLSNRRTEVLVLQTGQLLTEMARYDVVSENGAVIVRSSGQGRSELLGSLHVEHAFARLAYDEIAAVLGRFKMRLGIGKMMGLVRHATRQFRDRMHQFEGYGGGNLVVDGLDVPAGFPGLENGRLEFSWEELMGCFRDVVERVVGMVKGFPGVEHVFLAGSFANSALLRDRLCRMGGPTVWVEADCTSHGAVLQAKQLDFVNLQTS